MRNTTPKIWSKILTILEIKHYRNNTVIWESYNIPNLLHDEGQEFILSLIFDGDFDQGNPSSKHVKDINDKPIRPTNYFIGLDDRTTVSADDSMADVILEEPSINGYARQAVNSETGFTIESGVSGLQASTGIITFAASGGLWGPVSNMFITNKSNNSGYLIATAVLDSPRTVNDGETLAIRLAMTLKDC